MLRCYRFTRERRRGRKLGLCLAKQDRYFYIPSMDINLFIGEGGIYTLDMKIDGKDIVKAAVTLENITLMTGVNEATVITNVNVCWMDEVKIMRLVYGLKAKENLNRQLKRTERSISNITSQFKFCNQIVLP